MIRRSAQYRPPKAVSFVLAAAGALVKAHQTATAGGLVRRVDWWPVTIAGFSLLAVACLMSALVGKRWPSIARATGLLWGVVWAGRGILIWTTYGTQYLSTCGEHVALGLFGMLWMTRLELWRVDNRVQSRVGNRRPEEDHP